jgi:hypothetical protein
MTPELITPETEQFQCRHIFTDGRRCGSPAIRGPEGADSFCYFHLNSRRPIQHAHTRKRRQSRFNLPNPEDRSAIQQSIGEVLRRIASNEIDPRRAGLLLYGLQIASLNLPKSSPSEERAEIVSEVTQDPEHGLLAPPAELHANQPKGSAQLLLEELDREDARREARAREAREAEVRERTLASQKITIDLHATASSAAPEDQPLGIHRPHRCTIRFPHERMSNMSNFIPKPSSPAKSGLGPKAQKLAALREKAEQAKSTAAPATGASTSAAKPKNSFAGKKTAFQRKAT